MEKIWKKFRLLGQWQEIVWAKKFLCIENERKLQKKFSSVGEDLFYFLEIIMLWDKKID